MAADTTRIQSPLLSSPSDFAIAGLAAAAAAAGGGVWLTGQIAGLLFEFTWPKTGLGDVLPTVFALPHHLSDPRQAWPASARDQLPGPVGFWISAVLVVAAVVTGMVFVLRWRAGHRQVRGFASAQQLRKSLSARAVLRTAPRLRPSLRTKPVVTDVAVELGTAIGTGMPLYGSIETSVLVLAAPRQGKTSQIVVPWLRSFPGPALVTSVRNDVLEATATLRGGTSWVMELTGEVRWPHRVRWSPAVGCQNYDVARKRADDMIQVGKQDSADATNAGFFGLTATNLMAAWLHTIALTGRTAEDLLAWSTDDTNDEPVKLLRDASGARPGVLRMLDSFYRQPHTTRSNLWTTVQTGTTVLIGEAASEVFCGNPADSFDIEKFLRSESDTIYLLVDEEQVSDLAPLVTAFVTELIVAGKRLARQQPAGRLDPPLGLMLDEINNVVPLPKLAKELSTAAGFGIFTVAIMQNLAAAEERWGAVGRDMIWANSTIKIALGGLAGRDLEAFSQLAGDYRETLLVPQTNNDGTTSTQTTVIDRETMTAQQVRTLDEQDREALVVHATTPAIKTRMRRYYEGKHAKEYAAAAKQARRLMGHDVEASP